ncbi:MAG: hypothetical protein H2045_10245 [Rhizobiales bacterium]|nr:hypothetical protein [Hyphomicrobiales bacterium]
MNWLLDLDPLLPWPLIAAIGAAALVIASLLLIGRSRGAPLRALALAFGIMALINPVLVQEDREPLTSVAAVVIDRSGSQTLDNRKQQTDAALDDLKRRLAVIPNLEVRYVESNGRDPGRDGTVLFSALERELADVPPDQIAGAILLTDGEVHDVPADRKSLGFRAPIHTLLTGRADEFDRRLVLTEAPRFGIVGEEKEIKFRVESTDRSRSVTAEVTIRLNGENKVSETVPVGEEITLAIKIDRGGKNILEIAMDKAEGELTAVNNTAIQTIEGIRENLRVLLVSGEPHPGERTWRNLLKSDATVDLVHFTILRPPEKQDGTPINQLSLIAFPTRELFSLKINEFDLIIFDRYQRRGVLPILYFDNIARYVEEGGALLIAAGPDYADASSIYQTPLAPVLPAQPVGTVHEGPFHARITKEGFRHPVTRGLDGAKAEPPAWSRWFRSVDVIEARGNTVMSGLDDKPLLILNREGEGRVALMLSDHAWLWARGFEGGGPHVQLLRRLSHWLMKEPDLEEEALRGFAQGDDLVIERQTMSETPKEGPARAVEITEPTGVATTLDLAAADDGLLQGRIRNAMPGLYAITDGDLKTLAHMGPPNPKEFQEVVSTDKFLAPLAAETGGRVLRVADGTPRIVPLRNNGDDGRSFGGRDWFGLKMTDASILKGVNRISLFAGLLGLALLLGAFTAMWYREGR